MDMSGKETNTEPHKGSENPVNYHHAPNIPSDWQINGNNLTNTSSIGMIHMVESSSCSSASMVDSLMWDQPISGQNLGYCDVNGQNSILRGNMFLPSVPGMVPQSLPHFPADSAFIERAARFSCFGGGSFGEMMNTFGIGDTMNQYPRGVGPIQGPNEVFRGNTSKSMNITEVSNEGSPFKNEKKSGNINEEGKNGSGNESDEAEFSGHGGQEVLDSKKRKRDRQDAGNDENNEARQVSMETSKDNAEIKQKGDENPSSVSKPGGKNGKQGSQGSDQPKEEYIHVRARRGQATNSHSLAERVRREKISERMKFLQDLVPGCSKVTGKAVMLDEIINYVQSLQRQVEFLSMKLATVNPRLDFNIEGFLAKDSLQIRGGMSSSLTFPPEMSMNFPPLHPPGQIQACFPGTSSEALRRPINLQPASASGGFKEPTSQVPSVWEDELHNVVHMGFNSSGPLNTQDLSGCLPPGHMKAEP